MELLQPTHPPHRDLAGDGFYGFSSLGIHRAVSSRSGMHHIVEEAGNDKLHVAVGKSVERTVALLQWAFKRFGCREICILHVHQPSHVIPTLCKSVSEYFSLMGS
jgi:hypothetical protein